MRPVRLTIQAFGPYTGREVIDFREAVETGLFGIYGQTGSGKSSIFSAMTFALFGEPAKAEQDTPSLRSDHADAGMQTEVELVFDIGEQRFVVLRRPDQMRPKQRGEGETRIPHEAFLFDATGMALDDINQERGKVVAEKKVRDVDTAIAQMLGYGPEQFRQIVLLPQGRFETFLSAKTRERLDILRDLFDVSLYRDFAARLKSEADAAERHVREEREICARRLAAEGFESTDALATGIAEAEERHATMLATEKLARTAFLAAQTAVRDAEKIEAQFIAAEDSRRAFSELQAEKEGIDALADQVGRAEKARSLLDVESNTDTAAGEVREAEENLKRAREAFEDADKRSRIAIEALTKESERAGEIDDLRRQVDEFGRYKQAIDKALGISEAVQSAQVDERAMAGRVDNFRMQLTTLQNERREKLETLKVAHEKETRRHDIATRLLMLRSSLAAAEVFEKAERDTQDARRNLETRASEHEVAARNADDTCAAFESAERNLSHVQALHLASKLSPGAPCPVCGATDHPAPATGTVAHAGFDLAFRDAKEARQRADKAARESEQKLSVARSLFDERHRRLASLNRPEDNANAIRDSVNAVQASLDELGPESNFTEAEAEIEHLDNEIETLEKACDRSRDELANLQGHIAAIKAKLDEMLSGVPEQLRDHDAIATAAENAAKSLADRQEARATAEKAATETREAALATRKDLQAAEAAVATCKDRHINAVESFRVRLQQVGLTETEFYALKTGIAAIEEDRKRITDYRRKLGIAEENAKQAADTVLNRIRPDLQGLAAGQSEAEGKMTEATNHRAGADHRREHLTKLHDELGNTLRNLSEAEATSGPLRNLAALVNGDNLQRLDLETFAIGAMFDQVLQAANLRLKPMSSNRYHLERDLEGAGRGRRGLGIQIFDHHTGKARSTTTLSGGETFIAALALALGLADVVESASGKIRLDTVFIDEGFGSLDTENGSGTLDQVLQTLNNLVSQNRAVGLISHVPLVQEVIPNGFYVRKDLMGSHVETRGLM